MCINIRCTTQNITIRIINSTKTIFVPFCLCLLFVVSPSAISTYINKNAMPNQIIKLNISKFCNIFFLHSKFRTPNQGHEPCEAFVLCWKQSTCSRVVHFVLVKLFKRKFYTSFCHYWQLSTKVVNLAKPFKLIENYFFKYFSCANLVTELYQDLIDQDRSQIRLGSFSYRY